MSHVPSQPSSHPFESRRASVYGWALRIVGNHHDALDVTQDVGLRWLDQNARRTPANPGGWLRRATVNRAIDLIRGRRSAAAALSATANETPTSAANTVSHQAETSELRQAVARAIAQLSPAQQRVLLAKVFEGQTFVQIAADQSISASTAKTHFLRAVEGVRDALRPYQPPSE